MHRLMLSWKVVTPMVGVVLATLYLIQQSGDATQAPTPAPGTALIEQVATPPPLTWPGFVATVQANRTISAGSTDNAQTRNNPAEPVSRLNDEVAAPDPYQQGEEAKAMMQQALSAGDPSVRESAINQLAKINAPDVIYTLGHALQDGEVNNRRAAVNSLRELGYSSGDSDRQIRNLLLNATSDPDPSVATWAHEIIEGLNANFDQTFEQ